MSTRPEDLSYGEEGFGVSVTRDGTITKAQVASATGDVLGEGISRRAKGDRRNQRLGDFLAMARAFEGAADELYEAATEAGWGQARITFTDEEVAVLKKSIEALIRAEKNLAVYR